MMLLMKELSSGKGSNLAETLSDISRHGSEGKIAGPLIIELLSDQDWDLRISAAWTLGEIGYLPATKHLSDLLMNQSDWRLVFVAARSLGRLSETASLTALDEANAIKSLERVSSGHWYPQVKNIARKSIKVIKGKDHFQIKERFNSWEMEIYTYDLSREKCNTSHYKRAEIDYNVKLYAHTANDKLRDLSYVAPHFTGIIIDNKEEGTVYPSVALKNNNEWFAGSDRGEWGGELVYINSSGKSDVLVDINTHDIFNTDTGIIALTGMNHLMIRDAAIYKILLDDKGRWVAKRHMTLPGSPSLSWRLENGDILINTSQGSVIYTKNNTLEMAVCE